MIKSKSMQTMTYAMVLFCFGLVGTVFACDFKLSQGQFAEVGPDFGTTATCMSLTITTTDDKVNIHITYEDGVTKKFEASSDVPLDPECTKRNRDDGTPIKISKAKITAPSSYVEGTYSFA